eukprot:161294-Pyramimonas_sp.AAC.1
MILAGEGNMVDVDSRCARCFKTSSFANRLPYAAICLMWQACKDARVPIGREWPHFLNGQLAAVSNAWLCSS